MFVCLFVFVMSVDNHEVYWYFILFEQYFGLQFVMLYNEIQKKNNNKNKKEKTNFTFSFF